MSDDVKSISPFMSALVFVLAVIAVLTGMWLLFSVVTGELENAIGVGILFVLAVVGMLMIRTMLSPPITATASRGTKIDVNADKPPPSLAVIENGKDAAISDIKFECPKCKQSLEAPGDMQGQQIGCPTCSQAIMVPRISIRITSSMKIVRDQSEARSIESISDAKIPAQPETGKTDAGSQPASKAKPARGAAVSALKWAVGLSGGYIIGPILIQLVNNNQVSGNLIAQKLVTGLFMLPILFFGIWIWKKLFPA